MRAQVQAKPRPIGAEHDDYAPRRDSLGRADRSDEQALLPQPQELLGSAEAARRAGSENDRPKLWKTRTCCATHVRTILASKARHMTIRIQFARERDCALIADMSRRYVEHGLPWSWTESRVRYCLRNRECTVIVAREGRGVGGFAIMEFYDAHAHLNLLAVHAALRRRGVGRALVDWLESSSRVAGIFLVRLELRTGNSAAQSFYERLGYASTGVSERYYAGQEDALRMQHDLSVRSATRNQSL
jgi:ribosomal-protein-alanine N-acetyltransferase